MTSERLKAYRSTKHMLSRMDPHRLDSDSCELLRDIAEGLLLAQDDDTAGEGRASASTALRLLTASGRIHDVEADVLLTRIMECGPARLPVAAVRPPAFAR